VDDEKVKDAVDKVVAPGRLLDGEVPDTTSRVEAVHWLWVYAELLGFKKDVSDHMKSSSAGLPPAAVPEADAELTLVDAERRRIEDRYMFWRRRVEELSR
jgi:hypothetical protein